MTKEYTLEFMIRDDGRVICVCGAKAAVLNKMLISYMWRLIEEFQPEDRLYAITPPARSAELAEKANGPVVGRYSMTKPMAMMLNTIAAFNDPVSTQDVMNLCDVPRETASSKLSMLFGNNYLTRPEKGKYLVSPEGHAYLLEHANR